MKKQPPAKNAKTVVGAIDPDVLAFTVGQDPVLDLRLAEWDCYGTAAHLAALQRLGPCPQHRRSFAPVAAALAWQGSEIDEEKEHG